MIFNEIYGNYYQTIAAILDEAVHEPISKKRFDQIVADKAFNGANTQFTKKLSSDGEWPLLDKNNKAIIHNKTYRPITLLEKRWLKSLLLDPRIQLFSPDMKGLEDIEPLFKPSDIVFFDQFKDGDPYEDENYISCFKKILFAIKNQKSIKIKYELKNGKDKWIKCNPIRIEYSLRDDHFRLMSSIKSKAQTFNFIKIKDCEIGETFKSKESKTEFHDKKTVEFLIKDERQALERVMMQFSIYKKMTSKMEEDLYRCILTYEKEDEADLIIRMLSFGPNIQVVGPDDFVKQIKKKLLAQKSCKR